MSVQIERLQQFPTYYSNKQLSNLGAEMYDKLGIIAPLIATEELAELQKAISKWVRFNTSCIEPDDLSRGTNHLNLVEEIADVTIALEVAKYMGNISAAELNQMIAYKIDRCKHKLADGSMTNNAMQNYK